MSIPKGLILYKASRHENSTPTDIKYGYYSDTIKPRISLRQSQHCQSFGRKYQQKFIQKLDLTFIGDNQKSLLPLSVFSRFRNIKKLSIFTQDESLKKDLTIRAFQILFKTLKRLKYVEFQQFDIKDQQNQKTYRPLMLLTCLESIRLPRLLYYEDPRNLEPLVRILKLTSKRRCWPHFKSLIMRPLGPKGLTIDRKNCAPSSESLTNLLEFMQGLKSCENLQKCFNIQLTLPYFSEIDCEKNLETLNEIFHQMGFSFASLQIAELPSKIIENFHYLTNLKKVTFGVTEKIKGKADLSVLKTLPYFQELELWVRNYKGVDLFPQSDFFTQAQMMSNLTAFAFDIHGKGRPIEEFNLDLAGVIRSLINLRSLRLNFGRNPKEGDDDRDFKPLKSAWFEEVFKAIGERTKLKTLKFSMTRFRFENPKRLFGVFCENLKKLEELSELNLDFIDKIAVIEGGEIAGFCECLMNLKNLQNIYLSISCYKVQPEVFNKLLSCLANNLPLLSRLFLSVESVRITKQICENIEQVVKQQKLLNMMNVILLGQLEEGLNSRPNRIKKEMLKRFPGEIIFASRNNY